MMEEDLEIQRFINFQGYLDKEYKNYKFNLSLILQKIKAKIEITFSYGCRTVS